MKKALSYSIDLLAHANQVLSSTPDSELNEAIIRRCISNTYYAVFHLTTRGSAESLFRDSSAIDIASRAFEHTDMLKAYKSYLTKSALANTQNKGGELFRSATATVKQIIGELSSGFELLQAARHGADYDFTNNRSFSRSKALQFYLLASDYVNLFEQLHDNYPQEFNRLTAVLLFRKQSKML